MMALIRRIHASFQAGIADKLCDCETGWFACVCVALRPRALFMSVLVLDGAFALCLHVRQCWHSFLGIGFDILKALSALFI